MPGVVIVDKGNDPVVAGSANGSATATTGTDTARGQSMTGNRHVPEKTAVTVANEESSASSAAATKANSNEKREQPVSVTQENPASSTTKNESVATSTKGSDKDPGAVEGAKECVATNMNATRNSSSQGNDKKKRKKELAAAPAEDVRDTRNERVAALVHLQSQLKYEVPPGLKEEDVTVTAFTNKDRQAGSQRLAEAWVELKEIQTEMNKSSEKNSKEKTGQSAVVTQESTASTPAAETKVNSMEEANVAVRKEDDKVSAADDKGGSRAKATEDRIQALEKLRSSDLESARWMTSLPKRRNSFGKFRLFEESE